MTRMTPSGETSWAATDSREQRRTEPAADSARPAPDKTRCAVYSKELPFARAITGVWLSTLSGNPSALERSICYWRAGQQPATWQFQDNTA